MRSPSSRLTDDLYAVYMAAMLWVFLPFWASGLAEVLPSAWDQFDRWFDLAAIAPGFLGAWSGLRGGPLMLTRAAIVHELGAPISKRTLLLPWFVRQTAAWAMVTAVLATITLVLADRDAFTYPKALGVSAVAALVTVTGMCVAVSCLAAIRGSFATKALLAATAVMLAAPVAVLAIANSFDTMTGLLALLGLMAVSLAVAIYALEGVPVALLWKRAWAVEAMRSSTHSLDFQRVLLDLRNATERPPYGTNQLPGLRRLPLALWRHVAGVQHTWRWHLARLAVGITLLTALTWWGATSEGMVALALGFGSLLVGLEFTGALAATADQPQFVVHYPRGSRWVLQTQVLTTVLLSAVVTAVIVAGTVADSAETAVGIMLIAVSGALGAAMQARLGSPDLAAMLKMFGENLSAILWARALLGPLLVLATTVMVFHQYLRPDQVDAPFGTGIAVVLIAGFLVATSPLEKVAVGRVPVGLDSIRTLFRGSR